jgi:hypothetical protein
MSKETKFCTDCKYHLQCDGYGHENPRYHKCKYNEEHNIGERDIISGAYPFVTCKEMREGKCGIDAVLFESRR